MGSDLTVNRDRLWNTLMEMGQVGALPNGGCSRSALSEDDKRGRDLFIRWCREAGCQISFDAAGNIYARPRPQSIIAGCSHGKPPRHATAWREV